MNRSLLPLLFLAAALFAASAAARSADRVCSEDAERSVEPEREWSERELSDLGLTEEIVPCAALDSDHFGPHCAAARVLIHTDTGVLLCSILLPPLDLQLAQTPWVDPVPGGGSVHPGPGAALGAPAASLTLPTPPFAETPRCAWRSDPPRSRGQPEPDPLPG